jgi:hypothetical protein
MLLSHQGIEFKASMHMLLAEFIHTLGKERRDCPPSLRWEELSMMQSAKSPALTFNDEQQLLLHHL